MLSLRWRKVDEGQNDLGPGFHDGTCHIYVDSTISLFFRQNDNTFGDLQRFAHLGSPYSTWIFTSQSRHSSPLATFSIFYSNCPSLLVGADMLLENAILARAETRGTMFARQISNVGWWLGRCKRGGRSSSHAGRCEIAHQSDHNLHFPRRFSATSTFRDMQKECDGAFVDDIQLGGI